jgi:hypothetical protein
MAIAWDGLDFDRLARALRERPGGADAEKMIWAFERALVVACVDTDLLGYLLAATVCLLAWAEDVSPRDVLEAYFRRAIDDGVWRDQYRPLFG